MPTVWVRDDPKRRTRFHRAPDCQQLRKTPSRGDHHPLVEVDLEEVGVRPCHTCYPDAPHLNIRKAFCYVCLSKYACEHNGGIEVIDRAGRHYWVWPDTNQMPLYRQSA